MDMVFESVIKSPSGAWLKKLTPIITARFLRSTFRDSLVTTSSVLLHYSSREQIIKDKKGEDDLWEEKEKQSENSSE